MHRFFLQHLKSANYNFVLEDKKIIHQILKVLRMKENDKLIFFDSKDDFDYVFEIKQINKKNILFLQVDRISKINEKRFINLFQALPNKIEKIEFILKKGVEVGVSNFIFFKSQRSQRLNISNSKKQRFEKIVCEAVEQSNRNFIPSINFFQELDLSKFKNFGNFFLENNENNNFLIKKYDFGLFENINIFVGPEGGFSSIEIENFIKNGFFQIYLGENILRTETAGIASVFYINQILLD